jgi:hypothetical protein
MMTSFLLSVCVAAVKQWMPCKGAKLCQHCYEIPKAIAKTPINPKWRIATGCMTAQTKQMIYNVALKMPKALTTRASRNVRIDAKRQCATQSLTSRCDSRLR